MQISSRYGSDERGDTLHLERVLTSLIGDYGLYRRTLYTLHTLHAWPTLFTPLSGYSRPSGWRLHGRSDPSPANGSLGEIGYNPLYPLRLGRLGNGRRRPRLAPLHTAVGVSKPSDIFDRWRGGGKANHHHLFNNGGWSGFASIKPNSTMQRCSGWACPRTMQSWD